MTSPTSRRQAQTFNNPDRFIEGWYWALPSHALVMKQVKPVTLQGRNLAVYRTEVGNVVAVDAYCPHMGAHLAEGTVEGDSLRCFFHNWKFNAQGTCVDIPSLGKPLPIQLKTWPTAEKYGMIWVWTGEMPRHPVPFVPELEQSACDSFLGSHFVRNCHPNVLMINAIDAHHFNTVHNLPVKIVFEQRDLNENAVTFSNTTEGDDDFWFVKLIRPFYQHAITYSMCYWYGSTGTVTVGPDCLHFHIMFSLRLIADGKAEGQTILITKQRPGWWGWGYNRVLLWISQQVGNYFAKGDTQIFQSIRFNLKTPIHADRSILQFIHHVEQQPALTWGTWEEPELEILGTEERQHLNALLDKTLLDHPLALEDTGAEAS